MLLTPGEAYEEELNSLREANAQLDEALREKEASEHDLRSEVQSLQSKLEAARGQSSMLEQAIGHYKILMQEKRVGSSTNIKSSANLEQQHQSELKSLKQQLEESEVSWQQEKSILTGKNQVLMREVELLVAEVDRKTDLVNNTRGEWTKAKQANQRITKERNSFKQQLKDAELKVIEQAVMLEELR